MAHEFLAYGYVQGWPERLTKEVPVTIVSSAYFEGGKRDFERAGYRAGSVVMRVKEGLNESELIYQPTLKGDRSHIDTMLRLVGKSDDPRSLEGKSVMGIKQADRIVGFKA